MTDAYQIIAVCSCTLKDADAAARAYAKLDDKNRNLVRAALPEKRRRPSASSARPAPRYLPARFSSSA